ncbi:MAG: hypothetical protein A3H42_03555 [Deltaproteobacteria bacterium RIFCSPLOWO2_02_FULL_46_8]|nr:MAG: hypothetical protein A3H42_03555 [Deltaproteobacteria bacterium RIFCSPLOWO2_02_FULL_46_8]
MAIFFRKRIEGASSILLSPVSLIKPVCGLEKNLYENLVTAARQNYSNYEVIYSVQNKKDPALPILEKIRAENPGKKITIVVDETAIGPNGRLANLYNATQKASGEIFIFSDSDMFLEADYLKNIVASFEDKRVGVSCTLYKAWKPKDIPEALELLSFNADFVPSMVFAYVTKASLACPGASQAIRRDVLEKIGGLEPLANYLVEDFELGRRAVEEAGYKLHFVPYVAGTGVDLKDFQAWWRHQVYWDQNTRAANTIGFFFTLLIRGIPFAVLYALLGGPFWPQILGLVLGARLLTAVINSSFLKDTDGLKWLWLLPLRDLLGIAVWFASFVKRKTFWKGREFIIQKGKMVEI